METVLFDANFIAILLSDSARIPFDPNSKQPYDRAKERVEFLVEQLQTHNARILIPTPALSEFLIFAHPDGSKYLSELHGLYRLQIEDFDEMAAIELAELTIREGKPSKLKRGEQTWAKLKFDRQIVAIALARNVNTIYSTDEELRKLAERQRLEALDLCDTPLPPPKQLRLEEAPQEGRTDAETTTRTARKLVEFEETDEKTT